MFWALFIALVGINNNSATAQSCSENNIGFGSDTTANTLGICAGATGTAINGGNPSGGQTYTWQVSTTGPSGTYSTVSPNPGDSQNWTISSTYYNTPGTYYFRRVISGNATCNGNSDIVILTVSAVPTNTTISASPNPVCLGIAVNLSVTANGAYTYAWAGNGIVNANSNSTTATPIASGSQTYTVTVTNSSCNATGTVVVEVYTTPTASGATICQGGAAQLSVTSSCNDISASAGQNFAGTGANVTGIGSASWSGSNNIGSDNGSNATVSKGSPDGSLTSNYLRGTNFNFAIPSNATIDGIQVSMNRYASANSGLDYVQDNSVKLVKGGVVTGNEKASAGNWSTTTSTVVNYGGASDLWGTTWTPSEINASNFGVVLSALVSRDNGTVTANVDYVSITVYYTIDATFKWYTASTGGSPVQTESSLTTFNPVGDTEVLAAGAPYSSLGNTNTSGTYPFWVECSLAPGCRASADFVINANATADAGGPYDGCGTSAVSIEATASGSGTWSGGLGTFGSPTSTTTTYTPHASEVGSMVMLTWTTDDPDGAGPCTSVAANATLTIGTPATASAGGPYSTCGATPVAVSATSSGTGMWSGGAGTFASPTSLNTTYTPAPADFGTTVTLTWTTDDPDGPGGCMAVSADASLSVSGQDLDVKGNGITIVNGANSPSMTDHTEFEGVLVSSGTSSRTFIIVNSGNSPLTLTGINPVTISGANAGDFTVTMQPASPVSASGGMTVFQIQFDPSGDGYRTATVNIASDDCDENPFTFDIRGHGCIPPEITVVGNGSPISNRALTVSGADDTDFGSIGVGGMVTHTFTINNILNGLPLMLNGLPTITIADRDAADFSVTATPAASVGSGGSTTFDVKFQPSATGLRTAIVIITHNDLPENPFVFTINGTGL